MENISLPNLLKNNSGYFSVTYTLIQVNVTGLDTGVTW